MYSARTIVVTGGTRGLGHSIAVAFASKGDEVWILSRNAPSELPSSHIRHLTADVRSPHQLRQAVSTICKDSPVIDVWINNVGFGTPIPFLKADNAFWEELFTVNFWGTVHGTRAALPVLRRPGGSIINVGSLAALMYPSGHSAYSTSKAAVIALTRSNAVEFAALGIRVNAIAPGPLDTEGFRAASVDPQKRALTIPTRKLISPEEVAVTCLFLADPIASLTGQVLVVDGGAHAAGCYI